MVKTRTIYRDSVTGRFAKKSTWQRSKSQGGERYKREKIRHRKIVAPPPVPPPPPPTPPTQVFEWVVTFSYDKTGRSFDVVVTAYEETQAFSVASQFLRSDARGRNITRSKFAGWNFSVARGNASEEETGEAEYRDETKEE